MTTRIWMLAMFLPCFIAGAQAQYGTAPNNNYPDTYSGLSFTGAVTAGVGQELILTYKKDDKTDTFVGRLETGCAVASTNGRTMMASDIPGGTVVTAFFNKEPKKVGSEKPPLNVIIAISFETWHGEKVTEDKKRIFWCTKNQHLQYRTWDK
jgi:hypothetical protein